MENHMKKFSKTAYYTANLFLPLSDIARIARTARYALLRSAERLRRIKPTTAPDDEKVLSFGEVVAASGCSRDALMRRYLLIKRVWLSTFSVVFAGTLLLLAATLLAGVPVVGVFLMRVLSLMFMLSGLCGLLFALTLKNQFRLWQLARQRLGTFAEWRATGTWLRDIFSWQLR
jgi:hypothetical protein